MTKRWVRFVTPVMVEVDCEENEVLRVVTLPAEIRMDRHDGATSSSTTSGSSAGTATASPRPHPSWVAEPQGEYERYRASPPVNWPEPPAREEGFDPTEADDRYAYANPYGEPRR